MTWTKSLFINGSIKYDSNYETDGECIKDKNNGPLKGVDKQCTKLIANIRNNLDVESSKSKLANRIGVDNVNNIVEAIKAINQYNKDFDAEFARTPAEHELIDIIKDRGVLVTELSRKLLLIISSSTIMELFKDNTIDIEDLINLDEEIIEFICGSNEIIQELKNKKIDFDDLIDVLRDNLDEFSSALEYYSAQEILESYAENPLHLKFMAAFDDVVGFVYENSDDHEIVEFALEQEYIYDFEDICEIKGMIQGDREETTAAVMDFEAILMRCGYYNETDEEDINEDSDTNTVETIGEMSYENQDLT